MPSNTQQADRRVAELQGQIAQRSGAATMAAARLADPANLRVMLDRLSQILNSAPKEPIAMAMGFGRALEAIHDFDSDVKTLTEVTELRLQRDKLGPLTTAATERLMSEAPEEV